MRTKKRQKPSAILTSDWHLREDIPECRRKAGGYWEAQEKKIKFINGLQIQYNCPVLVAGDVFNEGRSSPYLLQQAIKMMPEKTWAIYGQHDLFFHNLKLAYKSNMSVVEAAGKIQVLPFDNTFEHLIDDVQIVGFHWEMPLSEISPLMSRAIALCHTLAYDRKRPFPNAPSEGNALSIMKKLKGYDLIITGDNHIPFTVKKDNQLLVNPGSLMRMSTNQADHKPRVYLWYAENNTVEAVYLPIKKGVVSREHIDTVKKKDKRMDTFIKKLDDGFEIGSSFKENLKRHFAKNKTKKEIKEIVWEAVE